MQPGPASNPALQGVSHIIAIASGKGGVGKSTVAANLALALHMHGQRVGLMDADIYGPSIPMMMGLGHVDPHTANFPVQKFGIKLMSLGFLPDAGKGVLLRGPMVAKWVATFLTQINWGELDHLIIDMPPGTGDAQLTLCQTANLTGAIIVTTPQEVSLIDAVKALNMFRQLRTPVIGVIENLSYFIGDDGKRYEIFRHGGGRKLATETGVAFLGEVPIDPRVSESGDAGVPIVSKLPDSPVAKAYLSLATGVMDAAAKAGTDALPEVQL
ncbi:MAG TPA: Mrp/NBP35 family ATP-binding protein [Gemmataceae bacterium]|nr:Mrp/NBP35 family ATP-binding protein [Gemmataceae bacterium]